MEGKGYGRDRRMAENASLRELVDALKYFLAARDDIWSLGFFDRLFNTKRRREVYARYDYAALAVKSVILGMSKMRGPQSEFAGGEPLISMEEFDALMSKPDLSPAEKKKLKERQAAIGWKGKQPFEQKATHSSFSPISPPPSSIAPITPTGASITPPGNEPDREAT